MLGVFMALDFFLFYVFWEVMLLPMYFLIGVWGGPRREYAAIKFFLFTLVGSVLMLVALLMLYFNSDVSRLSPSQQTAAHISQAEKAAVDASLANPSREPVHTFNLLALAEIGQLKDSPFNKELLWGKSIQWWAFLLLFIGFIIKVPAVPVHTWLPDAHVEAPTPISMILAGVLLKMGGYGILRLCYPICPDAAYELAWLVCGLGVVSMVYGAFAAMAQKDFKRLVAYSSVSHMGYVLLGIGVWTATAGNAFVTDYWKMGMNGAMFQMIAHGLSSAGMFFLVGVVYDRVHHRDLDQFGGLFGRMPVYSGLSVGHLLRRAGPAGAVRVHRRVLRRAVGVELQHGAGRGGRLGGDPHRGLHPVDHPAGLPGAGIQGPARRGPHPGHAAGSGHRRPAAGICDPAGRVSPGLAEVPVPERQSHCHAVGAVGAAARGTVQRPRSEAADFRSLQDFGSLP